MRFTLIDGLIPAALLVLTLGMVGGQFPDYPVVASLLAAAPVYLVLVPYIYRKFGLPPMVLPRCACCKRRGEGGYHVLGEWPRMICRCAECDEEFVVWMDGKVGPDETWERPVLALKWPYVFGPYRRVEKPASPT